MPSVLGIPSVGRGFGLGILYFTHILEGSQRCIPGKEKSENTSYTGVADIRRVWSPNAIPDLVLAAKASHSICYPTEAKLAGPGLRCWGRQDGQRYDQLPVADNPLESHRQGDPRNQ